MFNDQDCVGIIISLIPSLFIIWYIEPIIKSRCKSPYLYYLLTLLIWVVFCFGFVLVMDWIFEGTLA